MPLEGRGRSTLLSPSSVNTEFSRAAPSGSSKGSAKARGAALQPRDVASAVLWSLTAPRHVYVGEVILRAAPGWA